MTAIKSKINLKKDQPAEPTAEVENVVAETAQEEPTAEVEQEEEEQETGQAENAEDNGTIEEDGNEPMDDNFLICYWMSTRVIKKPLEFGINSNCRLLSMTNERRVREGVPTPQHTRLTFGQYNNDNEQIANTEFSFYDFDPTDNPRIVQDIANYASTLQQLLGIFNPDEYDNFDPTKGIKVPNDDLEKFLKKKENCRLMVDTMYKNTEALLQDFIGPDSTLVRLKVICNKNSYVGLPRSGQFIETMDVPEEESSLVLTAYEKKIRDEATRPQKPDNKKDSSNSRIDELRNTKKRVGI